MGREIYDIINDMAEVLNASQMQKMSPFLDNGQTLRLERILEEVQLKQENGNDYEEDNAELLEKFISDHSLFIKTSMKFKFSVSYKRSWQHHNCLISFTIIATVFSLVSILIVFNV